MKLHKRFLLAGLVVAAALLLIGGPTPQAAFAQKGQKGGGGKQQSAPSSKDDPKYRAIFKDVVAQASRSTVRVQCDGKDTALGVCITADGYILTKASDLTGLVSVKTHEGIILDARIVGRHDGHDLAMLKVEARGFVPIEWADSKVAPVGHFVASAGTGSLPIAIGVVSVAARDVPPSKADPKQPAVSASGYLGVYLDDSSKGAVVTELIPNSAAVAAKIQANDVILAVSEQKVKDSAELMQLLNKKKPGETVTLKILRGDEELELKATLGKRPAAPNRSDTQNNMGSRLSNRRAGFPHILQHDSVVLPEDCGGPLVDLEGRVVGINIARAGRVESYAIPAETIRPLLADLMGGKTLPTSKQ